MRFKYIMQSTHTKLKVRRWAAFLLCAALVGGMVSSALPALAAVDADGEVNEGNEVSVTAEDGEAGEEIYCEHHAEHTEECGYAKAVEGQPCTHEHDDKCGYVEAVECSHVHDDECGYVEGDEESCGHNHDDECGYAEAVECSHVHDDSCGYVEAVEGQPCQFVCDICVGGSEETAEELEEIEEDSEQIAAMSDVMPLADVNEKGLIAYFTFDDSSNRLHNYASGSNVTATLNNIDGGAVANSDSYFGPMDGHQNALRLYNNAYLALDDAGAFNGQNELTVEMSVYISEVQEQNWLFYAAPDNLDRSQCLGLALTGQDLVVQRYNGSDSSNKSNNTQRGRIEVSPGINDEKWHTVKVVYKISSMALYVDGKRLDEVGAPNKLSDYFGEDKNSVIWVGHSAWTGNTSFKGYIDDIKIYNYAKDDYPIDEQKYIVEGVNPPNTTVHMFDYWITEQTANDYNPQLNLDDVRNGGINKGHLFLFAGSDASSLEGQSDNTSTIGSWNNYYFDQDYGTSVGPSTIRAQYEPLLGIVDNILGDDGYPWLALDKLEDKTPELFVDPKDGWYENNVGGPTESLAYLFDLSEDENSKAAYPNVTGLFRLDEKGYYYFTSATTFAELNREQVNRPKTSTGNNKITLYARESLNRDFFPFNDGTDLFYVADGGNLTQANKDMGVQATTDEPLNHYFGMTVETKFKQAASGLIEYQGEWEPMEFSFSGDDDVWIFIDDVLVADLGGLHQELSVTIDFSTGKIDFTGSGGQKLDGSDGRWCFDTTFRERFELAGRVNNIEWNEDNNELFADGSEHTLKFFYLERGNNVSRCAISFNVQYDKKDRSRRSYEEQSPEEIEILDVSAELPAGVLASPHTGDSKMVVAWITLLVFSITGVIVLYRTRKRENK